MYRSDSTLGPVLVNASVARTSFFRRIDVVGGGEVRLGAAVGILWNGRVVRVNVTTINRIALWISRVAPWRT